MSRSTEGVFAPRYRVVSAAIVLTVTIFAFEGMAISTAMPVAGAELGAALGLDVHPGRPEVAQVEDAEEDIQGRGDRVAHSLDDSPRRRIP